MQPGRRQWAAGTSSRSQPRQGKEQPSPRLSSDVYFESCLLSFQVFGEVLSQPQLLDAGGDPAPPVWGCWRSWSCWGAKKQLPKCHCCVCR